MVGKTRFPKKTKLSEEDLTGPNMKTKKSTTPSALMMLSSQLLSSGRFNKDLPAFITTGLDSEQVWQQLELRNDHKLGLSACTREIVRISSTKRKRKRKETSVKLKKVEKDEGAEAQVQQDEDSDSESSSDEGGRLESIKQRLAQSSDKNDDDDFGMSDEDEVDELDFDFEVDKEMARGLSDEEEENEKSGLTKKKKTKPKRTTVVDDKFFKLADMEEFLVSEDLKEEKRLKKENRGADDESSEEEEEDEEDIDMFTNLSDDDDEMDNAKYEDFFDPPEGTEEEAKPDKSKSKKAKAKSLPSEEEEGSVESDQESVDDEMDASENESEGEVDAKDEDDHPEPIEKKKKVSFSQDLLESEEEETSSKNTKSDIKSSFQLKQEKLQKKAREMEELSLKETPWELTGETSASKRPENSLLETVLDFQHTTRAAPVITDDTTKSLEDCIIQRIKDKTFDDVERKEKPKEEAFEFKKRIVLDQEKSKQSLGELYEQEYLKQQQKDKDEVKADPECEKIEKDMDKLFHQLDALCNFKYTPMKPGAEVKIIVNTPSILMEEVAPVSATDADLLAPEEVLERKRGDLKATDERTDADRKRERRQKKLAKRERQKAKEAREKIVDKMNPGLGNKHSKAKAMKQLEKISKSDKNITVIKGEGKKLASSTSFFTQLQEEVQTNVKAKKGGSEKKKKIQRAEKLML